MRRKIIAGNWKMNKGPKEALELVNSLKDKIDDKNVDVVLCVPSINITSVQEAISSTNIFLGAQNVFYEDSGAYTGEISPLMLKECNVKFVIVGHSERREYFNETNEIVNLKVKKIIEHGLIPIMCCGETLEQREEGVTLSFIRKQIVEGLKGINAKDAANMVIAYEPIWAIGTGKTATSQQAQDVCASIRQVIGELYDSETAKTLRIQYGGSVNEKNAKEIFSKADIDGGLVGGASLSEDFVKIVNFN